MENKEKRIHIKSEDSANKRIRIVDENSENNNKQNPFTEKNTQDKSKDSQKGKRKVRIAGTSGTKKENRGNPETQKNTNEKPEPSKKSKDKRSEQCKPHKNRKRKAKPTLADKTKARIKVRAGQIIKRTVVNPVLKAGNDAKLAEENENFTPPEIEAPPFESKKVKIKSKIKEPVIKENNNKDTSGTGSTNETYPSEKKSGTDSNNQTKEEKSEDSNKPRYNRDDVKEARRKILINPHESKSENKAEKSGTGSTQSSKDKKNNPEVTEYREQNKSLDKDENLPYFSWKEEPEKGNNKPEQKNNNTERQKSGTDSTKSEESPKNKEKNNDDKKKENKKGSKKSTVKKSVRVTTGITSAFRNNVLGSTGDFGSKNQNMEITEPNFVEKLIVSFFKFIFAGLISALTTILMIALLVFLGVVIIVIMIAAANQNTSNESSHLDRNASRFMQILVEDGCSEEFAAAVYTYCGWEVGYSNLNPEGARARHTNEYGTFYGISSEMGDENAPYGLSSFAESRGTTWDDYETQVLYQAYKIRGVAGRNAWLGRYHSQSMYFMNPRRNDNLYGEYYSSILTAEETEIMRGFVLNGITYEELKCINSAAVACEIMNECYQVGAPFVDSEDYQSNFDAYYNALDYECQLARRLSAGYFVADGVSLAQIAINYLGKPGDIFLREFYHTNNYPIVDWCAIFVSYCAREKGVDEADVPDFADVNDGFARIGQNGRGKKTNDPYFKPHAGDLIWFTDPDYPDRAGHVAIVSKIEGNYITYVGGNQGIHTTIDRDGNRIPDYSEYSDDTADVDGNLMHRFPFCAYSSVSYNTVRIGDPTIYGYFCCRSLHGSDDEFICPLRPEDIQSSSARANDNAVDISCNVGCEVLASASGTVEIAETYLGCNYAEAGYAWDDPDFENSSASYGKYIRIEHSDSDDSSVKTGYAHLSEILVSRGEYVSQGQVIGYTGNTGRSSGPHLHFELYINGVRIADPRDYIEIG